MLTPTLGLSLLEGIALVAVAVIMVAGVILRQMRPPDRRGLRTDQERAVAGNRPPRTDPTAPAVPDAAETGTRTFVRRAADDYNCLGFTFGRRLWEIDDAEIERILEDNYGPALEPGQISVCCVIVWRDKGTFHHVGLVVQVTPDGKVAMARSKSASSNYVFDHGPDAEPNSKGYTVHRRVSTAKLGPREQRSLAEYQAAYDALPNKTTAAARDAAELLCQTRNGLINS